MNNPEELANQLLEDLGIDSFPIEPREICSSLDIHVFEEQFDGIEGVLLFDGRKASIGINNRHKHLSRQKFSIAHELGHFSMDIKYGEGKIFQCNKSMIETFDKLKEVELRADQFASELILPKKLTTPFFLGQDPCWSLIKEVSNKFDVSLLPTAFKYINNTPLSCCLVVSSQQQIKFYKASKTFRYSLQMNSRIISPQAYAHQALKGNPVPDEFNILRADNWISGINVTRGSELFEWSLPLNQFGTVLTLLWDNDSVVVDNDDEDISFKNGSKEKNYSYGGVDNFPWEPPTFGRNKRR